MFAASSGFDKKDRAGCSEADTGDAGDGRTQYYFQIFR